MTNKIYTYQIVKEISERTGLPVRDVQIMFNEYSTVLQEKIADAKAGDIVELAGGVGSLTVKLGKSRRYKSFESNDEEDVFVTTECKRRVSLNTYKATKTALKKQKVEYGITDADTLAYISQHKMSAKYTVKKIEVVSTPLEVEDTNKESAIEQEKKKGLARLLAKLTHKDTSLA